MKTFLAYRGGEVDEVATLAEVHALLRAVAEEVRGFRLPIGVTHRQPCDCSVCLTNERVNRALALLEVK